MQKVRRVARVDGALAALVAAMSATPALAALPFEVPFTGNGLPLRDWILMGFLVLLAVGLALRLLRHRGPSEPRADGADMRWWRNPSV